MTANPATKRRSSWRAAVSIAAVGLLAAVTISAASTVDWEDITVSLDGSSNTFDLKVAGSEVVGWTPSPTSWQDGETSPTIVALTQASIGPGQSLTARVAVLNASPRLDALITLQVVLPTVPTPLFDAFLFTISEGPVAYATAAPATALTSIPLANAVPPGGHRIITITVLLPPTAPDSLKGTTAPVQLRFTGENT